MIDAAVYVNGKPLEREIDFTVDPDGGLLLLRPVAGQIRIDLVVKPAKVERVRLWIDSP